MNIAMAKEQFTQLQEKMHAYQHALSLLYVDSVTSAPTGSAYGRGLTMGALSAEAHELIAGEKTGELLAYLTAEKNNLDPITQRQTELLSEEYGKIVKFPLEAYVEYTQLLNEASTVWHSAKAGDNYAEFEPYLAKIVDFQKKIAAWYDSSKPAYDVLLNEYEKDLTAAQADAFFAAVSSKLTPLAAAVADSGIKIDDGFRYDYYPAAGQDKLAHYLMDVMGIDAAHCVLGTTEHPFTDAFNKYDVRITTRYDENDLLSSMYSVIHEGGHALYELNIGDDIAFSCLAGGASMGMHESQSRLYENIIGRSRAFTGLIFPKLKELFPSQLAEVGAENFWLAANKSTPSLIRTEADELTYPLHIMVRYELEKKLIYGEINTRELPHYWKLMYKKYLGVDVPDDRRGVLQDSHWSGGSFGYFPTYALGSAYAAQITAAINRDFDVDAAVERGELKKIVGWLTEKIYRYGMTLKPAELIENCCGEAFDPTFYTDYLTKKYREIYAL